MGSLHERVDTFFEAYASNFNEVLLGAEVNIDKVSQCFSECFIEASPLGVNASKNNEQFKEAIPKGFEFYKRIGITSMQILSKDITALDSQHTMVKVKWQALFKRKDDTNGEVAFDVFYFLQAHDETFRIFAYITGDEQTVLKQEGLV